jgi:hypothetical protein
MGGNIATSSLDGCIGGLVGVNFTRDFTSDPANNSTFGTIDIRRTFTNLSGGNITRLRFRVVDQSTFPAPSGVADLRVRSSTAVTATVDRPPCNTGSSVITVQGTTLEQPPSQPNGAAFGGTASAGTITLGTPLANGASVDLGFLFGIQQTGKFKIGFIIEGLPPGGGSTQHFYVNGCTDGCVNGGATAFNNDLKSDILYRNFATGAGLPHAHERLHRHEWHAGLHGAQPQLEDRGRRRLQRRRERRPRVAQHLDRPGIHPAVRLFRVGQHWCDRAYRAERELEDRRHARHRRHGMADLLWWNSGTGSLVMLMNGFNVKAEAQVYSEPNTA